MEMSNASSEESLAISIGFTLDAEPPDEGAPKRTRGALALRPNRPRCRESCHSPRNEATGVDRNRSTLGGDIPVLPVGTSTRSVVVVAAVGRQLSRPIRSIRRRVSRRSRSESRKRRRRRARSRRRQSGRRVSSRSVHPTIIEARPKNVNAEVKQRPQSKTSHPKEHQRHGCSVRCRTPIVGADAHLRAARREKEDGRDRRPQRHRRRERRRRRRAPFHAASTSDHARWIPARASRMVQLPLAGRRPGNRQTSRAQRATRRRRPTSTALGARLDAKVPASFRDDDTCSHRSRRVATIATTSRDGSASAGHRDGEKPMFLGRPEHHPILNRGRFRSRIRETCARRDGNRQAATPIAHRLPVDRDGDVVESFPASSCTRITTEGVAASTWSNQRVQCNRTTAGHATRTHVKSSARALVELSVESQLLRALGGMNALLLRALRVCAGRHESRRQDERA